MGRRCPEPPRVRPFIADAARYIPEECEAGLQFNTGNYAVELHSFREPAWTQRGLSAAGPQKSGKQPG